MRAQSSGETEQLPIEETLSSFRPILQNLLAKFIQASEEKKRHRVMFVSPMHGDGTTTIATSTALMLAKHLRQSVALIEANLYTPAMASYVGIPPGPGLREVADGEVAPECAVRNSKIDGLYVLTAGDGRQPGEGELAAEPLRALIADVSERMRFTIIDAPPLLEHPETCLLLEHVDEVLLVVRAGSTLEDQAKAAVRIVEDAGVQVGGVFMNRYKPDRSFGLGRFT